MEMCSSLCCGTCPVLQALPALLGLHCCPRSPRAVPAVSVSVGAAGRPFFVPHPCSVVLLVLELLLCPSGNGGRTRRRVSGCSQGYVWVSSVSGLSPWFWFCSQDGFGWLKQGRHLLMGLSLKEGRCESCGGCWG